MTERTVRLLWAITSGLFCGASASALIDPFWLALPAGVGASLCLLFIGLVPIERYFDDR